MRYGSAMSTIVCPQISECCTLVKEYENEHNIKYDFIIITRFDLTFNNLYREYNIDYDKINMECMFVPDYNSGDNFILFKEDYLNIVSESAKANLNDHSNSHQLFRYFERRGLKCHYICGETSKRNPDYDVMFRFTRYL